MSKGKVIRSAGGIGESKIFCAPEGERPTDTAADQMLKCHIKGQLISTLELNNDILMALPYSATDEGIAEAAARAAASPKPSGATIGKENFEKALDQRRDDVKNRDMPMYEARDPLKEVADKFAVPGMKAKFLSQARIKDAGGTGAYEVVRKENGDPVTVKGMVLGHAPEEMVKARNKHFQQRGNQLLEQITEAHKHENGEKLADQ